MIIQTGTQLGLDGLPGRFVMRLRKKSLQFSTTQGNASSFCDIGICFTQEKNKLRIHGRSEEMMWQLGALVSDHKDWVRVQHPRNKPGVSAHTCNPSCEGSRGRGYWGLMASSPAESKSQVPGETVPQH